MIARRILEKCGRRNQNSSLDFEEIAALDCAPSPLGCAPAPCNNLLQTVPLGEALARMFVADLVQLFVGIEAEQLKFLYGRSEEQINAAFGEKLLQILFTAQSRRPDKDLQDICNALVGGDWI